MEFFLTDEGRKWHADACVKLSNAITLTLSFARAQAIAETDYIGMNRRRLHRFKPTYSKRSMRDPYWTEHLRGLGLRFPQGFPMRGRKHCDCY